MPTNKNYIAGTGSVEDQVPSIYDSPDTWAKYRVLQAMAKANMQDINENAPAAGPEVQALYEMLSSPANVGGGAGRGGQGGPTAEEFNSSIQAPPAAEPTPVALPTSIAPTPQALLKSDGTKDKYGVNAAEGGNRVNANVALFGVKATQDANGNVMLTNVGVPVGSYTKAVPSPVSSTVSNDLYSAINSLKTTSDPDIARGLLSNIRESAAQKSASLMTEAMKFASTRLGVPVLEQQLREAEAADRADPAWYPGIGDSPITAKVRQALLVTRSSVDNEAKNYLSSNTTYASMNAALKAAEEEAKRIDKIADRDSKFKDEMSFRAMVREDELVFKAEAIKNTLSPIEQRRLSILNPGLDATKDPKAQTLAYARAVERADKNPAMRAALAATEQDLPVLAMENNPHATMLVASQEVMNNPATTPEEVEARLTMIAKEVDSPTFADKATRLKFGSKFDSKEAKAYKNELVMGSVGLSAEGQRIQRSQKYAMALDMHRARATDRFAENVASWGVQDPAFVAALTKAQQITGKTDMRSVLTTFMEDADPKASMAKLIAFQSYARGAASKQSKSLFGVPDTVRLDTIIIEAARGQSLWEAIKQSSMMPNTQNTSMAPLGLFGAGASLAASYANNR